MFEVPVSNWLLIIDLRKGLSEKPPTMKMKLTGSPLAYASYISSETLPLI